MDQASRPMQRGGSPKLGYSTCSSLWRRVGRSHQTRSSSAQWLVCENKAGTQLEVSEA